MLRPLEYSNIFSPTVSKWGKITLHKAWSGDLEGGRNGDKQKAGQWAVNAICFQENYCFVLFLTALLLEMTAEVRFKMKTGTREKRESMNKCRG